MQLNALIAKMSSMGHRTPWIKNKRVYTDVFWAMGQNGTRWDTIPTRWDAPADYGFIQYKYDLLRQFWIEKYFDTCELNLLIKNLLTTYMKQNVITVSITASLNLFLSDTDPTQGRAHGSDCKAHKVR